MEEKGFIINKEFEPQILLAVFKRNWLWIPLIVLLLLSGAFMYLRYTKPIYESKAIVQIGSKDQGKDVIGLENLNTKKGLSEAVELMRSEFLFNRAIGKLNMNVSYFSKGKFLTEERYLQSSFSVSAYELRDSSLCQKPIFIRHSENRYFLQYTSKGKDTQINFTPGKTIDNADFRITVKIINESALQNEMKENQVYFVFNTIESLTQRLLPHLTVVPLNPEAQTIQLSYRSNNGALSRDVTQAVYTTFFEYDEELEKQSSQNILRFIDEQLDSLERELHSSKDSIEQFQRESNLSNPEQIEISLTERINTVSNEIFAIELELLTLRNLEEKITSTPNRLEIYKLIPELIGTSFESTLYTQVDDLHRLLEHREDLSFSMTKDSPEYQKANLRIEQRIESIKLSIKALKERLNSKIDILNIRLREFDNEVFEIPKKKMELSRLRNIQELNEKYFLLLMDKRSIYSISNAGFASKNIVLKESTQPSSPVSPNRKMVYGAALFIGLFLSMGIIALKYFMHNEINTIDDLKSRLHNVSFLGAIPQHQQKSEFSKLVVQDNPKSMISESFRGIRTNLNFINPEAKVYAVSSSISGEGKTFVCLNLAGILTMTGKKTVLIDMDLRKPKVHMGFETSNNKGMSTILSGQNTISDCLQKSSMEDLYFIPAGPIPPNPSELILSETMNETLEELKKQFDVIVIDNPPVGLVSDGIGLLSKADCPIYVFKANYSKRIFVNRVIELIEVQKIKGLSIILNAVSPKRNHYGYGYGYGNYYEDEPKQKFWKRLLGK